jgi:hypothetical protein
MFRAVTVRKSWFPKFCRTFTWAQAGPPAQLPTGLHQKPVLEILGLRNFFQLFFFRSFSPFLAVFARPSAAYSFTIRRRDLEKFFNFSDLENFFNFHFRQPLPYIGKWWMFRAVTVRKSSFPRGSPDFHQSPGRTDPLNCRPVTTKNRSWNFSDLEIFSNFFSFALSLFFSRLCSSQCRL